VQAAADVPLTVYGKGGQTRGYLNIIDTLACVELAIRQPANAGQYRVFNQFVETFSVNELAARGQAAGKILGLSVQIKSIPNPRREAEEHYYNPSHTGLLSLGLQPHYLTDEVLTEMLQIILTYKNDINKSLIYPDVQWKEMRGKDEPGESIKLQAVG
jgi:UDP-sulfoquinovose synthase